MDSIIVLGGDGERERHGRAKCFFYVMLLGSLVSEKNSPRQTNYKFSGVHGKARHLTCSSFILFMFMFLVSILVFLFFSCYGL